MHNKINKIMITLGFLGCLSFFGIWSLFDEDKMKSEMEGRVLAQKPEVNLEKIKSGQVFTEYENYYNDHFPLRDKWVEANAAMSHTILKQKQIKGVYMGDSDYLISIMNPANGEKSAKTVNNKINELGRYLKDFDIPLYFSLVPNKSTIMEDKLPNYIEAKANYVSDILVDGFSEDVNVLDHRDVIQSHMDEDNMYFYTDHHWKPKAAFYAYQEVINHMSKDIPTIGKPLNLEDYKWEENSNPFYGSEARKVTKSNIKKPDTVTVFEKVAPATPLEIYYYGKENQPLFNRNQLENKDTYTNRYGAYLSGDVPEGIIKNKDVKNGKKLLILKDSYANAMIPFFTNHFEETRFLDLRFYTDKTVKDYIKEHDIDAVIFVHNINSITITPSFLNF